MCYMAVGGQLLGAFFRRRDGSLLTEPFCSESLLHPRHPGRGSGSSLSRTSRTSRCSDPGSG